MVLTITHNNEAVTQAIYDNAEEAAWGLMAGDSDRNRASVFAVMVCALEQEGWTGQAAHEVLGNAMDGYDKAELEAAKTAAASITNPWSAWSQIEVYRGGNHPAHGAEEEADKAKEAAEVLRRLLRTHAPIDPGLPPAGGETLDLAAERKANWLCEGILARGRTHMLSGSWGAAKSLFREQLMAASLLGQPFLGRPIPALRWMIVDGENAKEDVEARWKALGLDDGHLANVHFTGRRRGVKLGRPDWNKWLEEEIEAFRPDVLVIDSVMRCCVLGLSNEDATALYDELFVPLADKYDLAVVFTHHHRKSGAKGNQADAALGGMQFTGQADLTMTLAKTSALAITLRADGSADTVSRFAARFPKSGRGAYLTVDEREYFEARGVVGADKVLRSLSLDHPRTEPSTDERIVAVLADGPLGRGALADSLKVNQTGSPFRSALKRVLDANTIVKNDDGLYELVER